jgi:hypothetical protein
MMSKSDEELCEMADTLRVLASDLQQIADEPAIIWSNVEYLQPCQNWCEKGWYDFGC